MYPPNFSHSIVLINVNILNLLLNFLVNILKILNVNLNKLILKQKFKEIIWDKDINISKLKNVNMTFEFDYNNLFHDDI